MTRDEFDELGSSPDTRTFEHIGGPLHLQIRAIPDNQWRGYEFHQIQMKRPSFVEPVGLPEPGLSVDTVHYDLRTVHLRDREGHLRIWTGMVLRGYWQD